MLNRLLGRSQALVSATAGTTRDHTRARVLLPTPLGAVAVHWLDTPGLRDTDDAIEARAMQLTRQVIAEAEVLITLAAPDADWVDADALPREPDLYVWNKADVVEPKREVDAALSAATGAGVRELEAAVLRALQLHDLRADKRWWFSDACGA